MKSLNTFTFHLLLLGVVLAIASIGFTAGCTTPGNSKPLTEHQQIENVCISISAGFAAAAVLNDRSPFSAKQQGQLTAAATETDKVCTNIPNSWLDVAPGFTKATGDVAILSKGGTPP